MPTWLVLPDNIKVYTKEFLPSGSPLDQETPVLQILPAEKQQKLPTRGSMDDVGIWYHGFMRLPAQPMQELHWSGRASGRQGLKRRRHSQATQVSKQRAVQSAQQALWVLLAWKTSAR